MKTIDYLLVDVLGERKALRTWSASEATQSSGMPDPTCSLPPVRAPKGSAWLGWDGLGMRQQGWPLAVFQARSKADGVLAQVAARTVHRRAPAALASGPAAMITSLSLGRPSPQLLPWESQGHWQCQCQSLPLHSSLHRRRERERIWEWEGKRQRRRKGMEGGRGRKEMGMRGKNV